jgi:hypothetical protein
MSPEQFQSWYFQQPGWVQEFVVAGPPFLVMMGIGLALGARFRLLTLAWLINPPIAAAVEIARSQSEEEAGEAEWTEGAKKAVDELVTLRRRGL